MTQNQIAYWSLQETGRSNRVKEKETQRTNKANEKIKDKQVMLNYDLGLRTIDETIRANKAREAETNRHNLVVESQGWSGLELQKANLDLGYANLNLGFANLAETTRSHKAQETLSWSQLDETTRSHIRNENIASLTSGYNYEVGSLNAEANLMNAYTNQRNADTNALNAQTRVDELFETRKHNRNVEDETHRSNVTEELLKAGKLSVDLGNLQVQTLRAGTEAINGTTNTIARNARQLTSLLGGF